MIRAHYPAELHIAEILHRGNIIIVQQKYENEPQEQHKVFVPAIYRCVASLWDLSLSRYVWSDHKYKSEDKA